MILYDKKYLSKRAAKNGFNRDTYEKVLRLMDVLEFLNQDDLLRDRLALKGGTAINLLEFNLPRLSVDIDLDYTINVGVDDMKKDRKEISDRIFRFMEEQGYLRKKSDRQSFVLDSYYFTYINTGGNKNNIKFDINYVMRAHLYDVESRFVLPEEFGMENPVNSLNSIEIYGSKINALNNRAAARDLYDVYKLVKNDIFRDSKEQLRKAVIFYHVLTSEKINGKFDLKAADKLNQHSILRELVPVLKKGEIFILEDALKEVRNFVEDLMMITDCEMDFITRFNNGEYSPELLFEDDKILNNVVNHPMAKWKASKLKKSNIFGSVILI
ncbi:nucleotidyl transferase AbiEii/AbiGii toxin family protein [Acidaminobacter sp. JC074]|uniref:nucleotidyl transferase AbiEii/AbiGii toxin family protein n=1 Tax=Acidaminobacter sp. JC074 TaxID=2530199 RepID=UPI001F0F34FA|nr:nucleotidyl transferase AbiEii/AbiGii toxin family protein [Acidaminobacter sp. JC074]